MVQDITFLSTNRVTCKDCKLQTRKVLSDQTLIRDLTAAANADVVTGSGSTSQRPEEKSGVVTKDLATKDLTTKKSNNKRSYDKTR